ncbi:Hypothetical protein HVR_LOCUS1183 [uncultured virus]|nr:Hypothetical protein HVR_LOCUS1183 [uncultured virus]
MALRLLSRVPTINPALSSIRYFSTKGGRSSHLSIEQHSEHQETLHSWRCIENIDGSLALFNSNGKKIYISPECARNGCGSRIIVHVQPGMIPELGYQIKRKENVVVCANTSAGC